MKTHRSDHRVSHSPRSRLLACGASLALTLLGATQASSAATETQAAPVPDATTAPVKLPPFCPDGRICHGNVCFCV